MEVVVPAILFIKMKPHVDGIPSEKVCFFGLTQLFKQELIEISSRPIKGDKQEQILPLS